MQVISYCPDTYSFEYEFYFWWIIGQVDSISQFIYQGLFSSEVCMGCWSHDNRLSKLEDILSFSMWTQGHMLLMLFSHNSYSMEMWICFYQSWRKWLQQNFAHVMTAVPSSHVQNFVAICMELNYIIISFTQFFFMYQKSFAKWPGRAVGLHTVAKTVCTSFLNICITCHLWYIIIMLTSFLLWLCKWCLQSISWYDLEHFSCDTSSRQTLKLRNSSEWYFIWNYIVCKQCL